jgi:hypothetical protein
MNTWEFKQSQPHRAGGCKFSVKISQHGESQPSNGGIAALNAGIYLFATVFFYCFHRSSFNTPQGATMANKKDKRTLAVTINSGNSGKETVIQLIVIEEK